MKTRGSAMIIAFFLMAAIGGVAFGIGRIFLLDAAISSLYESGTVAYYAAESGVEEGLLRYRFDQNAKIYPGYDDPTSSNYGKCTRRNLHSGNVGPNTFNTPVTQSNANANSQSIYDIAMKYKAQIYGDTDKPDGSFSLPYFESNSYGKSGEAEVYHIKRDEAVKIDVTGINATNSDLTMYVKFANPTWNGTGAVAPNRAFIEAKVTATTGNGTINTFNEYKLAFVINNNSLHLDTGSYSVLAAPTPGYYKADPLIKTIIFNRSILNSNNAELTIKPVGADIYFALVPRDNATNASSPWTTVKSVGYYGDATRTLTAKIDRQSGTVYDLYDFVVYKHK